MSHEQTTDPVAVAARAAAGRLAAELGGDLPMRVEAALAARDAERPLQQYVLDPISLGSLIVAIASLAWTIRTDLAKQTPRPANEVVARSVRIALRDADGVRELPPDRVVEVVVEEVLGAGGGPSGG
ncbi:MAG TPA: hypothetical protein VF250_09245 [Conexibacter sp.]